MIKKETAMPKKAVQVKKPAVKKETPPQVVKTRKVKSLAVRKSHIQKYIRGKSKIRISEKIFLHLSKIVESLCDKAIKTAKQNKRKTLQSEDFDG